MNFRIIKEKREYIVQVEEVKWTFFGLKRTWQPFVKSVGLDCAWHHKNFDFAMMNLLDEVKKQTIKNARFNLKK